MRGRRRRRTEGASSLRAIPIFSGCTDDEWRRVERLVDVIDVAAGEAVTSERETPSESYVIATGEASVVVRERSVGRLATGDVFGQLAGLWADRPATATVTAITPLRVVVVDRRDLAELVAIPGVAQHLASDAVRRLHAVRRAPCS